MDEGDSVRVAVVTGGGGGLGLATVTRLLADGFRVAAWDRSEEALQRAAAQHGGHEGFLAVPVDIRSESSVQSATDTTTQRFGAVSALVAVAGTSGPFLDYLKYPLESWNDVIAVNLTGSHLCVRALVPGMLDRGWGRIVTVSSMAGKEGNPRQVGYSAAKAGLIGFTKALAKELATSGVLINSITPALFETELMRSQSEKFPDAMSAMIGKIPMNRPGRPAEFAALASWLVSEECSFTTGSVFDLSGGRATY